MEKQRDKNLKPQKTNTKQCRPYLFSNYIKCTWTKYSS